jgi:hypothetical protein
MFKILIWNFWVLVGFGYKIVFPDPVLELVMTGYDRFDINWTVYAFVLRSRVADPQHFNADPDSYFHFHADPDPTFHFNPGPDSLQSDANLRPLVFLCL